jgi:hypothetical protein
MADKKKPTVGTVSLKAKIRTGNRPNTKKLITEFFQPIHNTYFVGYLVVSCCRINF